MAIGQSVASINETDPMHQIKDFTVASM